jgi:hypothetical protein
MKPWFQCALTPWKSGFMASAPGPTLMINLSQAALSSGDMAETSTPYPRAGP